MPASSDLRSWWELHRRRASGDTLSAEEMTYYSQHLAQLEADEVLADDLGEQRGLCEDIRRLELECDALRARRIALAKEIARLDALLDGKRDGDAGR